MTKRFSTSHNVCLPLHTSVPLPQRQFAPSHNVSLPPPTTSVCPLSKKKKKNPLHWTFADSQNVCLPLHTTFVCPFMTKRFPLHTTFVCPFVTQRLPPHNITFVPFARLFAPFVTSVPFTQFAPSHNVCLPLHDTTFASSHNLRPSHNVCPSHKVCPFMTHCLPPARNVCLSSVHTWQDVGTYCPVPTKYIPWTNKTITTQTPSGVVVWRLGSIMQLPRLKTLNCSKSPRSREVLWTITLLMIASFSSLKVLLVFPNLASSEMNRLSPTARRDQNNDLKLKRFVLTCLVGFISILNFKIILTVMKTL